ncbi:hypothetical protein C0389_09955 [bacterium]|nr:hypothetical protein [bacterium]
MDNSIAINRNVGSEYNLKNWHLFFFITCSYLIITLVTDKFIMTRDVFQILLSDRLESYRIDDYYEMLKRFSIYSYLAIPLITWLKITFIALLIQTPIMLKNIEVSFKEMFKIAAIANIPYIVLGIARIVILFLTPKGNYTNELLSFTPGSITNLLRRENYNEAAYSFLSNINTYEALWILLIYIGLKRLNKIEKADAFFIASGVWLGLTALQFGLILYLNKAL